jgi:periplasmic divalent cation tolerance protein
MEQYIVVYITCASKAEADELAAKIVSDRLAACATIIDGVKSVFHWHGKIDNAEESLIILKTRKKLLKELINFVQLHHSYDVPEIIALPIVGGSDDYLNWIEAETLEL